MHKKQTTCPLQWLRELECVEDVSSTACDENQLLRRNDGDVAMQRR